MTKDFIPKKKDEFFRWVNEVLMPMLSAHYTEWGIASIDNLVALNDVYNARTLTADNPTTRTPAAIKSASLARSELTSALRKFLKAYITYNPLVTVEDKINMHLPLHDTIPTPAPVPTTYPEFEVDSSTIRRLALRYHNAGGVTKAKPNGVHGAEIRWAILDTQPTLVDEIKNSAFATRSPYRMEFTEAQRGLAVYFCMRWETNKGEKGPWSEIVKAIIP